MSAPTSTSTPAGVTSKRPADVDSMPVSTPKRQVRPSRAETPDGAKAEIETTTAPDSTNHDGEQVVGYIFRTDGDMEEVRSRSLQVKDIVERLFRPKLYELHKRQAEETPASIDMEYLELPECWLLVMDEDGMVTQPPNDGFGWFMGNLDVDMYGRILLLRTTEQGGDRVTALPSLPAPLPPTASDNSEAVDRRLQQLYKIVKPFRRVYMLNSEAGLRRNPQISVYF